MYRNTNHLVTLAAVAKAGSFAGAARRLGMPTSTVTNHIAALEADVGLDLIQRTTRSIRLTDQGHLLAQEAQEMVDVLQASRARIVAQKDRPAGKLRISVPFTFASDLLAPVLVAFSATYPDVQLEVVADNAFVDLIAGGFDLAVRIGQMEDSSLTQRKLGDARQALVAAKSYLDRAGRPVSVDDLDKHKIIALRPDMPLVLAGKGGSVAVALKTQVSVNDPRTIAAMALHGGGIAALPLFLVDHVLKDARLEVVLPEQPPRPINISLVYYGHAAQNPLTRLFVDFVADNISF
ncbi:LysR family transcriptional regulator [Yoonia sp. SDW83-1]|uniref:LysR family transcriptional regulator n=1 Tax=Yoonia sp. SDW83-1 TaxID=3366945 RepID=UPI00398C68FC